MVNETNDAGKHFALVMQKLKHLVNWQQNLIKFYQYLVNGETDKEYSDNPKEVFHIKTW